MRPAAAIVTVTANPAYDVTYEVPTVVPGEVHRVQRVHQRLGGKGINVARVLGQLGKDSRAICLGHRRLERDALCEGLELTVVPALPDVRRTVVVSADDRATTSFWEPGSPADADAADNLATAVGEALETAAGLVVSGSVPPNVDKAVPSRLAAAARAHDLPVVVDADDESLAFASEVPGVIIMPNADELARLVGHPCTTTQSVAAAGRRLVERGASAVLATRGSDGIVCTTTEGVWHSRLDHPVQGNPTGAGDAAAAATIAQLVDGASWPDILVDAVAASAAALHSPVAGSVDTSAYTSFRSRVIVTRLDP